MSSWTKQELENMLSRVIDELDLSENVIAEHGQLGTEPAIMVRLVLRQKDREIALLKRGFVDARAPKLLVTEFRSSMLRRDVEERSE